MKLAQRYYLDPAIRGMPASVLVGWTQPRTVTQPGRRSRGRAAWQPWGSPAFLPSTGASRPMVPANGMPEVTV